MREGALVRLALGGGEAVVVPAEPLALAGYPALAPDGRRLAFTRTRFAQPGQFLAMELWLLDAAGEPRRLAALGPGTGLLDPVWTPDGQAVLATAYQADGRRAVVAVDLASGRVESRVPGGRAPGWTPAGGLAHLAPRPGGGPDTLWAEPAPGQSARPVEGLPAADAALAFAWSQDGRWLALLTDAGAPPEAVAWPPPAAPAFRLAHDPGAAGEDAPAPVGSGRFTLRVLSWPTLEPVVDVPDDHPLRFAWSPDSRWLAFFGSADLTLLRLADQAFRFVPLGFLGDGLAWLPEPCPADTPWCAAPPARAATRLS